MWFLNCDQKSILGSGKNVVFAKWGLIPDRVRYHLQVLHNVTKLNSLGKNFKLIHHSIWISMQKHWLEKLDYDCEAENNVLYEKVW